MPSLRSKWIPRADERAGSDGFVASGTWPSDLGCGTWPLRVLSAEEISMPSIVALQCFCWWALRESNPRPSPCKGETNVLVRALSREKGEPLSTAECLVVPWARYADVMQACRSPAPRRATSPSGRTARTGFAIHHSAPDAAITRSSSRAMRSGISGSM